MCDFVYHGPNKGYVTLGTHHPSKILRFKLSEVGGSLVCQKGSLLCSPPTVNIDVYWAKSVATGLFGGQGFILQHLQGDGDVLIKGSGNLIRRELARGEKLQISHGCLLAFTKGIHYGKRFKMKGSYSSTDLMVSFLMYVYIYFRGSPHAWPPKHFVWRRRSLHCHACRTRRCVVAKPTVSEDGA